VRGDEVRQPAISADTGRLVYESWSFDADLWLVTGSGEARPTAWSSSVWDGAPSFSPDGRHVAFVSVRGGAPQVWLADRDGGTTERLTQLHDASIRLVRWSEDGRRIAFVARGVERNALYVIDVERRDGHVVFRTSDPIAAPSFADGDRELWFGRSIDARWGVWSLPSSGGDRPRLRIPGAFAALAAPGEPGVAYYTRFARDGLWRIDGSRPGARPERIVAELAGHDWANWSATDRGIVYPVRRPERDVRLDRYDPASGRTETIASLPWPPVAGHAGIAVSPRGELLVTRVERASSDLVVANLTR
jgi:dipeptidyl aminopeptidase/acylaminoacyl peptidase